MKETLVLYQFPIALTDLKNWLKTMIDKHAVLKIDWTVADRLDTLLKGPEEEEIVRCRPFTDLSKTGLPTYDKLVLIGAISEELKPYLAEFLLRGKT